jgi:hypothetical protein
MWARYGSPLATFPRHNRAEIHRLVRGLEERMAALGLPHEDPDASADAANTARESGSARSFLGARERG